MVHAALHENDTCSLAHLNPHDEAERAVVQKLKYIGYIILEALPEKEQRACLVWQAAGLLKKRRGDKGSNLFTMLEA